MTLDDVSRATRGRNPRPRERISGHLCGVERPSADDAAVPVDLPTIAAGSILVVERY